MHLAEPGEQDKNQKAVLESKLRPPRLLKVLERPRLLQQPQSSGAPRLINICAGPGFGKTTLMAQMAREFTGNRIWYQVDSMDRDPAVFLRHMISGFSHACGFEGKRARSRLGVVSDFAAESESVLAVLLDESGEHSKVPLMLCFDDYHLFDEAVHAAQLVEYLIQKLPEQSCVVITTRSYPSLSLGRLRSHGALMDLKDEDLQFSIDELASLTEAWEIQVSSSVLKKVYKSTEGWAAGLVLTEKYLRSGSDIPELFSQRRMQQNVYEYLAEEVLNTQPVDMQQMLIKAALIDPVDPVICETALETTGVSEMLAEAEQRNLFTSRLDDADLFRYHPLFRDFLLSRMATQGRKDEMNNLRISFAEAYLAASQVCKAIDQYLAADQHPPAIALIEKIGDEMLSTAEYGTLEKWIDSLKEDELTPALHIQRARILMSAGKFRRALGILKTAEALIVNSNIEQLSRCLLVKAECLTILDQYEEAICLLRSLLELSLPESMRKQVLFQLCIVYWDSNDQEGLQSSLELALKEPSAVFSPCDIEIRIISCMQNLRNGNFRVAHELLVNNLKSDCLSESYKNLHLNNLASCLMMMGDYLNAMNFAEECKTRIEDQREFKLHGVVCDTLGCLMIAIGSEKAGSSLLAQALEQRSNNEQKSDDMNAVLLCHLGSHARRQGNINAAIEFHTNSITYAGPYEKATGKSNIGADLVRIKRFREAEKNFIEAHNIAKKNNFSYVLTQIDFNRAWAAYLMGDISRVQKYLSLALGRANEFQQNHFIIQEGKTSLPLFKIALENGIEVEYTCWILKQIGEETLSVVEPFLKHESVKLRENIADILCDIGSTGALSLLRRMRHDSDERVQKKVKISLDRLRQNLKSPNELLTPREAEVLEYLSCGLTNNQIAQKLYIADCTVKTHVVKIFRKLGFTNRIDAIIYAQKNKVKSTTFYN
ncbi:MAG: LuxR C-terminal-related transcriptional regulator [Thermoleophilia bacterium]